LHHALHGNAFNPDTGQIAECTELSNCNKGALWRASCADEIGRLCHGHGTEEPTGTDTMVFIPISAVPKGTKATYLRIVAAFRPEKANPRRVRFTVGGDRVCYDGDVSTKTADLTAVKTLLNSVISTPEAKFVTVNLKDFYLETPMEPKDCACMRIPVSAIPEEIMLDHNLAKLVHNNHVCVKIRKGMHGLTQAGRLANARLIKFLAPHGHAPVPITPGLWTHSTQPLAFTLVVDNFGMKHIDKAEADHLLETSRLLCKASVDWDAKQRCGLNLVFDWCINRTCDISVPGHIERALQRFQHPTPQRPQHAPHAWVKPHHSAKTQCAPPDDASPPLDAADTKRVQEVLGTLLFHACAIDSMMLPAVGSIASQQAKGTNATMEAIIQLLNYCAIHPVATVRCIASDMVMWVESGASHLTAPKARSRAAGCHCLSTPPKTPTRPLTPPILRHLQMAPSASCAKSCAKSSPAPPKLSSHPSSTTAKRPAPSGSSAKNSDIPSPQRLCKLTTALPLASPTTLSNRNGPKRQTCAFTGSATAFAKSSSASVGKKASQTRQITSPNLVRLHTIKRFVPRISTRRQRPLQKLLRMLARRRDRARRASNRPLPQFG
jgi:hypothetical protein